jgi:Rieske Fe-S protein
MTQKETTDESKESSKPNLLRRRLIQVFGGLGIVSFVAALLAPLKDLGIAVTGSSGSVTGQELLLASEYSPDGETTYEKGATVTDEMLSEPDSALVYPSEHVDETDFIIRLHKLPPDEIGPPTIDDMTANGHVAYSGVCTHLGCEVDWKEEQPTATGKPTDYCNCHGSQFDPYAGAEVVHAPANRPLPQIGIEHSEEGKITLTSNFEERVGP